MVQSTVIPAFLGGIGIPELILILVIVLIVFGAGKLPQIGDALGKGIRNFRSASNGNDADETKAEAKASAPKPKGEITAEPAPPRVEVDDVEARDEVPAEKKD